MSSDHSSSESYKWPRIDVRWFIQLMDGYLHNVIDLDFFEHQYVKRWCDNRDAEYASIDAYVSQQSHHTSKWKFWHRRKKPRFSAMDPIRAVITDVINQVHSACMCCIPPSISSQYPEEPPGSGDITEDQFRVEIAVYLAILKANVDAYERSLASEK